MKMKVTSHIDVGRNLKRVQNDGLWKFAANEWWKLMTPYVPMDTGTLSEQVEIRPGEVEYTAPYAHAVYESNANFRRDKHPLASDHWDKAAEPVQKPKLIAAMQGYIDKGGLDE